MRLRVMCLCVLATESVSVLMEGKAEKRLVEEEPGNFKEALGTCLAEKIGTLECVNRGILSTLQAINEQDELKYDNVYLERASGQNRELLDLDYDPRDFGNLLKAGSRLMEQRGLKWDLSNWYPGLVMQVGPKLNEHGVLEFVIDERAVAYNQREIGTGQLLARNLLLPFLLGFKFNLASMIPLLFGALLIITKKAFILAKIAIFLSGFLGWNSLVNGGQSSSHGFVNGNGYGYGPNFHNQHPIHYKDLIPDFNSYNQHVIRDTVDNIYDRNGAVQNLEEGRNFAWARSD